MFNSLLKQHDKINALQEIIVKLQTTGTISMESADAIERIIPGELSKLNPDILFDLEETGEGVALAMEGVIDGLSKVKIAFIIAIIAFIVRYISTLGQNGSNIFSSGGGGGWGGSAPAKFTTNHPPVSQEFHDDTNEYEALLADDINSLQAQFATAIAAFKDSLLDNDFITGLKTNKTALRLVHTLKQIIRTNGGIPGTKTGFLMFTSDTSLVPGLLPPHQEFSAFVSDETETEVTAAQIKQLPRLLEIIRDHYNPAKLFNSYYLEEPGEKDKTIGKVKVLNKLGIPYFVLNKEMKTKAMEFANLVSKLVDNSGAFSGALKDINELITPSKGISGSPDANELKATWDWVNSNLGKTDSTTTAIKTFVVDVSKIIEAPDYDWGDTTYFNTLTRAKMIKDFVRETLEGGNSRDREVYADNFAQIEGSGWIARLLWSEKHDAIGKLFDGVVDSLADLNSSLESQENQIIVLTKECESLETAIALIKHHPRHKDDSPQGEITLRDHAENNDNYVLMAKESPRMITLLGGLTQMLLLSIAAIGKYNVEINKLGTTRVNLVIGKGQEVATNFAKLTKDLNALTNLRREG